MYRARILKPEQMELVSHSLKATGKDGTWIHGIDRYVYENSKNYIDRSMPPDDCKIMSSRLLRALYLFAADSGRHPKTP